MKNALAYSTISQASSLLERGECSAREVAEACLAEAKEKNRELNAYLELFDESITEAEASDARRSKGEARGKLDGIPLAVKDNILMKGKHASAGSKILESYVASYDATAVKKLREAGAVLLGRTNLDEFAMGSSTEHSAFGATKNPLDPSRVPGGSSGGSAAAVAMGGALAALGSDTGGSIRQPAAFCGLVGLKPTYGAVSRYGLIAMGSSLDQIGPLARSVEDAELLFDAIRGRDAADSTSLDAAVPASTASGKLTIGVPMHLFEDTLEKDVLERFTETLAKLEQAGHTLVYETKLPSASAGLAAYYIVMPAEASTNLARFDGVRYGLHVEGDSVLDDYRNTRGQGFGREVRRRILLGTYVLSAGYYDAYYAKAEGARGALERDFTSVFDSGVSVIATPTTPSPAFRLGEKSSDPLAMYLEDVFTVPANLTGMPALSVPMGKVVRDGVELPVGIQFTAPKFGEGALFAAGRAVETL